MKKKLSLTVGITTCYGDKSILETVESIRASKGVDEFPFIIIADRVPINEEIKKSLRKYNVRLVENKKESGQVEKQKQIRELSKTDITIFTQDDVLFDKNILSSVLKRFAKNPKTTMISIPYLPVKATSFFEEVINVGTNIVNKTVGYWNNGDNYLSCIGRFMAFRTETLKKFRMPKIAVSDNYYYFENKKMGGEYEYAQEATVYFKNPQNMKEHLRKSSRFQHSQKEVIRYFGDLSKEYTIPKSVLARAAIQEFLENPINTFLYIFVFAYTRILKMKPKAVLNPIWEVDLSTKKVSN
ncbi:MAG: glycosyltransferase [Candidatus Levybacteria bacterium]|nr:glycosyltransferase [Candidatus Levybacteria bacterium]